jgi:RNA polymerase sigma-70 factor (ECF subfamily)
MANSEPDTASPAAGADGGVGARSRPDAEDQLARERIARARAGDAAAISALLRELLPAVRVVVRARLQHARPGDLARPVDDLVQDLCLRLFAHDARLLCRWQPERGLSLTRFVALIADRLVISELRLRRAREAPVELDEVADSLPDTRDPPEAWLEHRQTLHWLFMALSERLSPLGRRLFQLLFVEELEITEICARTQMGADAVYAWRSRLRRQAAQLLAVLDEPLGAGR